MRWAMVRKNLVTGAAAQPIVDAGETVDVDGNTTDAMLVSLGLPGQHRQAVLEVGAVPQLGQVIHHDPGSHQIMTLPYAVGKRTGGRAARPGRNGLVT